MKKLLNSLIQPLIRRLGTSANRTNAIDGRRSTLILAMVALICLGLLPTAYATGLGFVPYAGEDLGNGNSAAQSVEALVNVTSGVNNTATGFQSLYSNISGSKNTATGCQSLLNNTTGINNTANGAFSLFSNTAGWRNTATGARSLQSNIDGIENTATGESTLRDNTSGIENTAIGTSALQTNTSGSCNTASGYLALTNNTTAAYNTATGFQALLSNTTGAFNTATGVSALGSNTSGAYNTATGFEALGYSTATGNTAFGSRALRLTTIGYENTAMGYEALSNNTSGVRNVALGKWAGNGVSTATDVIAIGAQAENVSSSCYIGQIFGRTVSGGTSVFVNSAGRLGTATSSRRFKEDIHPMKNASETLFALNPVTFRYKKELDPQGIPQFGLIAEEVEKVNPDLIVRDKEGKVNTVRYEQINAMLLNEFLKEHKKVEQLKSEFATTISSLRKEIGILTAQLKEQSEQIQKVSAQIATSQPAPRVATNR